MSFVVTTALTAIALCVAMLLAQEIGRRLGERHRRLDPDSFKHGYGATEGIVFALLGLFLAFTFSGAGTRFDARRHLIVQEANAISTAWLRLDVLPEDRRPAVRALFRDYLDARLAIYRGIHAGGSPQASLERSQSLQQRIWSDSVDALETINQPALFGVLLPALNAMFDITTTRTAATRQHPPAVVYAMIGLLALMAAVLVGYGMAGRTVRSRVHTVGFAVVLATVLYVIIDIEFPRLGFVRVDASDQLLVDLRETMN